MPYHAVTVILVCAVSAISGCNNAQNVEPNLLLPGIRSHMSSEEVRKQIVKPSARWSVIEDTKTPVDDKRPPFHLLRVAIGAYSDLDEPGALHLQFFNNRLISATFYPKDAANYLVRLKEKRGIVVSLAQKSGVHGVSIHYATDFRGQPYIEYADEALQQELNSWIRRYSQLVREMRPA